MFAAEQDKGIIALPINGITPSALTVNEVRYQFARGLSLNTVKSREPLAATAFIRFVQSSEGQKILSNAGIVRRFELKLFSPAPE
jgi:ABC-type phosphate transport system substrate-binding protein